MKNKSYVNTSTIKNFNFLYTPINFNFKYLFYTAMNNDV